MHALACLALALAAAPAVEVPLGDRDVPVDVALELRTSAGPSSPPLAWRTRPDGTLEGAARTAEVAATVRLVPAEGGAAIVDLSRHASTARFSPWARSFSAFASVATAWVEDIVSWVAR